MSYSIQKTYNTLRKFLKEGKLHVPTNTRPGTAFRFKKYLCQNFMILSWICPKIFINRFCINRLTRLDFGRQNNGTSCSKISKFVLDLQTLFGTGFTHIGDAWIVVIYHLRTLFCFQCNHRGLISALLKLKSSEYDVFLPLIIQQAFDIFVNSDLECKKRYL